MIAFAITPRPDPGLDRVHRDFQALLPRIELHARIFFRGIRCPARREDAVAETVAISWKWFLRLTQRGKDPSRFVTTFAFLAALAVGSGRRLCGQLKPRDVLSER